MVGYGKVNYNITGGNIMKSTVTTKKGYEITEILDSYSEKYIITKNGIRKFRGIYKVCKKSL